MRHQVFFCYTNVRYGIRLVHWQTVKLLLIQQIEFENVELSSQLSCN